MVSIPHRYGKNGSIPYNLIAIRLFPFLIGTVRTVASTEKRIAIVTVSIPHRYGKNI